MNTKYIHDDNRMYMYEHLPKKFYGTRQSG